MSSFYRLCISTVSRRELSPGADRCLHGGGREALPVCVKPHHQRQACKSQQPAYPLCLKVFLTFHTIHEKRQWPLCNSTLKVGAVKYKPAEQLETPAHTVLHLHSIWVNGAVLQCQNSQRWGSCRILTKFPAFF